MKTSKSVLKDDSLVTIYRSTLLRNTAGIFYSSLIDFVDFGPFCPLQPLGELIGGAPENTNRQRWVDPHLSINPGISVLFGHCEYNVNET